MNDLTMIGLAAVSGIAAGILFFGGLWLTVQKAMNTPKRTALWFGVSYLLRLAIVLPVFYFAAKAGWQYLVIALAAFIISRTAVLKLTKAGWRKKYFEKGGAS